MNIRYRVDLSEAERVELEALLRGGRHAARKLKRAQILLAGDDGLPDERKLTGHEEALLVATACSRPPEGRARWTIDLLAGEMVRLTDHGSLSGETVRRRLAENKLKPWREKMWCETKIDGDCVARMEENICL